MMLTEDLIENETPVLNITDHISKAREIFKNFPLNEIPVLGPEGYIGIIKQGMISNKLNDTSLQGLTTRFLRQKVSNNHNIFEAFSFFTDDNINTLPVIDKKNNYLGSIYKKTLLKKLGQWLKISEPGGIIQLHLNMIDYSLAEMAQIVETNGAKILNCLSFPSSKNSKMIDVILKINQEELSSIIKTFERYEYQIKASFHKNIHKKGLDDRFDSFIRYLNV